MVFLKITSVALLSVSLMLIGCGGGGGSSSNQTDPLAKTAAVDISNQSVSWTPQQAKWVGKDTPAVAPEPGAQDFAPLLRRSFKVKSVPKRVVIHVAAYGLYVAYLNGVRIGTQVLEPPPTKFESDVLYGTFDVTGMVHVGQNAMGIKLGRGLLGIGGTGNTGAKYRGEPRVMAELDIEYADGSHEYIGTDGNWKVKDSATRDAMMYGEVHDASAQLTNWHDENLDDRSWSAAKVQTAPSTNINPRLIEPTRVISTFEPAAQRVLGANRRVYDFGVITAGWTRLQVEGAKGTVVTLTYGEQLNPDGTVYQATLIANPTKVHVDRYTLSGNGKEIWEPDFTRHGFRYVQVDFSAPIQSFTISARRVHSALETVGEFTSSSEILNRLHANQANTIAINFAGIPIDTPWRDRLPWTADAWLFMDSARHNYDINRLYAQWIKTVRAAQDADGTLTGIAPDYPSTGRMPVNDPAWGGTMIKVVWSHYQAYGDRKILVDNFYAMKRWVDLIATKIAATGNLYTGYSFGDWASPGSESTSSLSAPEDAKMYGKPLLTANGELYQEVKLLSQIASALGKSGDAASLTNLADNIKTAFNSKFFDIVNGVYQMPGSTAGYRQTSNLIPLAYGLVPESQIAKVYANLVADIRSRGNHLNTGSVGTKLVLPVLSDHGDGDLAYALATQTTYPSWGYWLTQGATSTWETWSNAKLSQSLSHPFIGTYQEWLYEYLAGIQSASPGYTSVKVKPVVPSGLDYASASLKTPQGTVVSGWRRNGNTLLIDVTIPSGVTADIYVPTVGSGAVSVSNGFASVVGGDKYYVHYQTIGDGSALRFTVK